MVLVTNAGRLGKVQVGNAVDVDGVISAKPTRKWNTEKVMHLQDTAPSNLMNYMEWTITIECHADYVDAGQIALRAAFEAGTPIAVKVYDTATGYITGTGVVTSDDSPVDPSKSNIETFTIESNGTALTHS